jgi:hypothetical protein
MAASEATAKHEKEADSSSSMLRMLLHSCEGVTARCRRWLPDATAGCSQSSRLQRDALCII